MTNFQGMTNFMQSNDSDAYSNHMDVVNRSFLMIIFILMVSKYVL